MFVFIDHPVPYIPNFRQRFRYWNFNYKPRINRPSRNHFVFGFLFASIRKTISRTTLNLCVRGVCKKVNMNKDETRELLSFGHNKQIPPVIKQQALKSLSFYPELKNAAIRFNFKENIRSSVMQAQPVFSTLLRKRKNRRYRINISTHFKLSSCDLPITEIPEEVMVGWIVHELGHIMDYEHRTNAQIVLFGTRYLFSPEYVKEAERIADTYAVEHGSGKFILATKRFILDHTEIPQEYKNKIKRLYLSPDIIVDLVKKLEDKKKKVPLLD